MNEFRFVNYAQEIIFGAGSIAHLDEVVEHHSWQRLMLCSTGSLRRNGTTALLEKALGARLVAVYEHVQPHVPDFQVAEATSLAGEQQVDAVIGMGGGSPIGMAKAVGFALKDTLPGVAIIAIPTTYAGSEMTPTYGITHHVDSSARKITVTDARIVPQLVIYDPSLTLELPPDLTASTGINALAHCIEALYSITRNPLSTVAAIGGVRAITRALPICYENGEDEEARSEMLQGAFLAGSALSHVLMGLHHGLCHVLGGTADVPHGIANGIILPHAMRFNCDTIASQLLPAVEAMGIALASESAEATVEKAIQHIYSLIGYMKLPQRLRDAGVKADDLSRLAQIALQSQAIRNNPKSITSADQIESVLRAAW